MNSSKSAIGRRSLPFVPAIVLAGAAPAGALELGELEVQSRLGQPLRASVAYALGPNEALGDYCVSLAPGGTINGLPAVNRARITVTDGVIAITGSTPVREPLMSARLSIQCPYTPNIARDYMLFIDPAEPAEPARPSVAATSAAPARAPVTRPRAARPTPPATERPRPAVASGSVYRVQPGDSLSAIASRLEGREVGLWQAVNAIFVANPDAFIDNDPNRLKAGSLLEIPAAVMLATAPAAFPAIDTAAEPAVAGTDDTAYLEPAENAVAPVASEAATTITEVAPVANATPEVGSDNPFVATGYPDTVVNAATSIAPEPSAPEASIETIAAPAAAEETVLPTAVEADATGRNLIWGGLTGLLAIIAGLLWFRRRRGEPESTEPEETTLAAPHPMRRITDDDSIEVHVIAQPGDGIDFDLAMLDDEVPTEENPALEAAMLGEGFDADAEEPDVDIGRASGARPALDLEIPEGSDQEADDSSATDMIPPQHRSAASILESEVLPEEDEYDMSVIVDATKMPAPEEATERDLHAVVINDDEEPLVEDGYTLSKEVDYQILEQDYEDELTATQALNREIERAAAELVADMDDDLTVESETLSGDETAALPLTNVTELDVTANMRAGNDDEATASDADDATAEITARMNTEEKTVEMAAQRPEDATAEIEVESGRVGKRAG